VRTRLFEGVAKASDGPDISAAEKVWLELLPYALDANVDGFGTPGKWITPGQADQLVPIQNSIGIRHQGVEEGQLARRESHGSAVHYGDHSMHAQRHLTNRDLVSLTGVHADGRRSSEQDLDPRQQDPGRIRLDQVIVCSGQQPADDLVLFGAFRHDHERDLWEELPDLMADAITVMSGKNRVQ
jgi:hypothetical protein